MNYKYTFTLYWSRHVHPPSTTASAILPLGGYSLQPGLPRLKNFPR